MCERGERERERAKINLSLVFISFLLVALGCSKNKKNPDEFVLMSEPNDTEKYKIRITDCYLCLPIAQLNAPVYTELSTILSHKSASLHFRKTEIRLLSVPKDKLEYNSDLLYPDDSPCRITFAFVDEKAREGSYSKNPFEFRRSWEVIEQLNEQPVSREELLEKELQILREKLQNLERKVDGEPERRDPERRDSILGRLRSSFAVNQEEDQESEASE